MFSTFTLLQGRTILYGYTWAPYPLLGKAIGFGSLLHRNWLRNDRQVPGGRPGTAAPRPEPGAGAGPPQSLLSSAGGHQQPQGSSRGVLVAFGVAVPGLGVLFSVLRSSRRFVWFQAVARAVAARLQERDLVPAAERLAGPARCCGWLRCVENRRSGEAAELLFPREKRQELLGGIAQVTASEAVPRVQALLKALLGDPGGGNVPEDQRTASVGAAFKQCEKHGLPSIHSEGALQLEGCLP